MGAPSPHAIEGRAHGPERLRTSGTSLEPPRKEAHTRGAILPTVIAVALTVAWSHVSVAADACSFLTKDIAAAALGEAVTGPRPAGNAQASACEYQGSGIHKINLNVMQLTQSNAAVYKSLCDQKGKDGLSGLGPTACWYNDKHEELQVLKGTTFFSIEMRRAGDTTEAIKGAAKKIFDQIK